MGVLSVPATRQATTAAAPAHQAYLLLRTTFVVAPIAFGIDKFLGWTTDWPQYLWSGFDTIVPGTAAQAMLVVGVIEILAGLLVAVRPRLGALVVAAWLGGIIVNLLLVGGYLDIALRDAGLLVGAVALSRLALAEDDGALSRQAAA